MAFCEYVCQKCKKNQFAFDSEEGKLKPCTANCTKDFQKMPPNPTVIHTTDVWMAEPHIDSYETVYELDRILTLEAANERETKLMLEARKNQ